MSGTLSAEMQERQRARFRRCWESGIGFQNHCGVFHGGVVATLVDNAGTAAVLAGHDFTNGDRPTTVDISLHSPSVAPRELVGVAGSTKGRTEQ